MGFSEILTSMAEAMVEVLTAPNTNFSADEISAIQKAEAVLRKHNWNEKADAISIASLLKEASTTGVTSPTPTRENLSNFEKIEKVINGLSNKGFRVFTSNIYACTYLEYMSMYVRVVEVNDDKIHVIVSFNKMALISTKKLDDMFAIDFVLDGSHIVDAINRGGVPQTTMQRIKDRMIPILSTIIKDM